MNKLPNLVFIGGSMVGKTTIVNYLSTGKYSTNLSATIGAAIFTYNNDDYKITTRVWDTAGQEKFDCLIPSYIRNGDVFALTFDASTYDDKTSSDIIRESVKRYFTKYIRLIIKNLNKKFRVMIILNKCDLVSPLRYDIIISEVSDIIREVLASEYSMMHEDDERMFRESFDHFVCIILSSVYGIGFANFNSNLSIFIKDVREGHVDSYQSFASLETDSKPCYC